MDNTHEKINYVELAALDMATTRAFFQSVFAWQFTDYGDDYMAFSAASAGLEGGFYRTTDKSLTTGGALVVFYSCDLAKTQAKITANGGIINRDTFSFPGGRRFHFTAPCGNEYAVWSDT